MSARAGLEPGPCDPQSVTYPLDQDTSTYIMDISSLIVPTTCISDEVTLDILSTMAYKTVIQGICLPADIHMRYEVVY